MTKILLAGCLSMAICAQVSPEAPAEDVKKAPACQAAAPGQGDGIFQSASDRIAEFHPKVWFVRPMKAAKPVKKERMIFQKCADGVKGMPDNIR